MICSELAVSPKDVCDNFLTNSLEVMCQSLGLSEDIAGVSLLALGGSLPELAIHSYATIQKTDIGVATVVGSALFNLTVGVAIVCVVTPAGVRLSKLPLLRDSLFYLACLSLVLLVFRYDLRVTL